VAEAYRLPRATGQQRAERTARIRSGLFGATAAPVRVIGLADRSVSLAEQLRPLCTRSLLADLASAVSAARAAATISRLNVEVNLAGRPDPAARDRILTATRVVDGTVRRADRLAAELETQALGSRTTG
jgi:formiminotetrahydrofolate cyclodeaminase